MNKKPTADADTINIDAVQGWVPLNLYEIWHYRELVYFFLWRDLKGRYRQMALGPVWLFVNPVINMLLATVIFGRLAGLGPEGVPYPLFNYTASLMWGLFASTVHSAASSLLDSRGLISKVYFPRLVMPLVGVLTGVFNFFVSSAVLVGLMIYYRHVPSASTLVVLPVMMAAAVMCGLAVGLWWASWMVHYRDLGSILGFLMKGWMYACPVVYATDIVPAKWLTLYHLNPVTNIIEGARWALLGMPAPPLGMTVLSMVIMIPLLVFGAYYFRKTERSIVDIA
jgi:lipopolysaccharide transport system permease protein